MDDAAVLAAIAEEDYRRRNPNAHWVGAAQVYRGPGDVVAPSLFTAFWGLRAFSSASISQAVPATILRRSSDSVTQIFTPSNVGLDQSSISTFKGAANLTVAQFFDQSGNGNHVVPQDGITFEQAFTLNVLNGKGVYDNTAANDTRYATTVSTFPPNTALQNYSAYGVYLSVVGAAAYQTLFASRTNEVGIEINPRFPPLGNIAGIKNEGTFLTTELQLPATDGIWHAVGGSVIIQSPGPNSFFNVDNVQTTFADMSGLGNDQSDSNPFYILGDRGPGAVHPHNQLVGYFVECGWLTSATGIVWTTDQVSALIANARHFWGI